MSHGAVIDPNAFYDQEKLRVLLDLSNRAIGDACRSKRLRFTQQAGRRFFRGSWIIAWLEGESVSSDTEGRDHAVAQ